MKLPGVVRSAPFSIKVAVIVEIPLFVVQA
jgi:hypothetical protein